MTEVKGLIPIYARTARDLLSAALFKLENDGLDAAVDDLTNAATVMKGIPDMVAEAMEDRS
jgi:hypothetical protein